MSSVKEIAKQVKTDCSGKWISIDDAEKLVELAIRNCASHIMSSSDRYRKEYFASKVLELLNEHRID